LDEIVRLLLILAQRDSNLAQLGMAVITDSLTEYDGSIAMACTFVIDPRSLLADAR
jgi:hypothetical protein